MVKGIIKILVGLVVLIGGGVLIWSGVRDVRLGVLDEMILVKAPECCRVCGGEQFFCQDVCPGDKVHPSALVAPVMVCGNEGCVTLKAGDKLNCHRLKELED